MILGFRKSIFRNDFHSTLITKTSNKPYQSIRSWRSHKVWRPVVENLDSWVEIEIGQEKKFYMRRKFKTFEQWWRYILSIGPPDEFYEKFDKWGLVDMTGMPVRMKREIFPRGKGRKILTPPGVAPYEAVLAKWLQKVPKSPNGLIPHQFKKVTDRNGKVKEWCSHCGTFVWLITERAFKCDHCGLHSHSSCAVEQMSPKWPMCAGSQEMRLLLEERLRQHGIQKRVILEDTFGELKKELDCKEKGIPYEPPPLPEETDEEMTTPKIREKIGKSPDLMRRETQWEKRYKKDIKKGFDRKRKSGATKK